MTQTTSSDFVTPPPKKKKEKGGNFAPQKNNTKVWQSRKTGFCQISNQKKMRQAFLPNGSVK